MDAYRRACVERHTHSPASAPAGTAEPPLGMTWLQTVPRHDRPTGPSPTTARSGDPLYCGRAPGEGRDSCRRACRLEPQNSAMWVGLGGASTNLASPLLAVIPGWTAPARRRDPGLPDTTSPEAIVLLAKNQRRSPLGSSYLTL